MSRVIAVVRAEPPEPPEPSADVVRGLYYTDEVRYFDRPSGLPGHRGPYRMRVSRPDPRALRVRVHRVLPPDWDDDQENQ